MNIIDYTNRFFDIERRLCLFDEVIDGVLWWDAVRHDVFYFIYYEISGISCPTTEKRRLGVRAISYIRRTTKRWLLSIFTSSLMYDVLIFRAPRKIVNGHHVDESMDGITKLLNKRKLVIDTYPTYYHRRPRRDDSIVVDSAVLLRLIKEVEDVFGTRVEVIDLIQSRVAEFFPEIQFYMKLLNRIAPQLILLTQNGIEKGLIIAARRLKIPLIEVQHGLINYVHPAYSYPKNIDYSHLQSLPDYLFTYSCFWSDTAFMPLVNKISVGKAQVSDNSLLSTLGSEFDFLVVSADVYDDILRDYAKQLASRFPGRKIGYKLHPNQRTNEGVIRVDLKVFSNVEVLSATLPIAPLLRVSCSIVAIQSTVVYEALQAGVEVFILPHFDYLTHYDIFHLEQVHVLNSVDSLDESLIRKKNNTKFPIFFEQFNSSKVKDTLLPFVGRYSFRPFPSNDVSQ